MTLLELVRRTRTVLDDWGGDRHAQWGLDDSLCYTSNATLVGYLDDARREYRRRNPIRDAQTDALCAVTAAGADEGRVELDPRILAAVSVRIAATGWRLPYASPDDLERQQEWDWRTQEGEPGCWTLEDDGALRLVPMPTADLALRLTVERLPLAPLTWESRESELSEVPATDQDCLKWWAAAQVALARDQSDLAKYAAPWLGQFAEIAGPPKTAQEIRVQARLAAGGMGIPGLWTPGRRRIR